MGHARTRIETLLKRGIAVCLATAAQFVVGVLLAVWSYPGQYSFTRQFLSELGCSTAQAGQTISLHAWIFNLSLAMFGAGLAFFFASLTLATKDGKTELPVMGICGTLASVSLVLVAAIPMDVHEGLHLLAMFSWLFLMVPMSAAWMCWLSEWHAESVVWPMINKGLIYALVLYVPATVVGFGPSWQKSLILFAFVWLFLLCGQLIAVVRKQRLDQLQKYKRSRLADELSAAEIDRIWLVMRNQSRRSGSGRFNR
jgi:hypothetical protein